MSNRTILYMTGLVVVCVVLLLGLNLFSILQDRSPAETYLKYNEVRGIDVTHKQKPYTLNFDQQKELIGLLNQAKKTDKRHQTSLEGIDFEKITIYLFNGPDIVLTPITLDRKNLIYSVPKWNPDGFFEDDSHGAMLTLISQTYDRA